MKEAILIGFGDGSLVAYGCAIYVRWKRSKILENDPDRYYVRLVCGKARVTSLKGTTAPRSEICGFLILTRLLKTVMNSMDEKLQQITRYFSTAAICHGFHGAMKTGEL